MQPSADGRKRKRPQNRIADVRYDFSVAHPGFIFHFRPLRMRPERGPRFVPRRHIVVGKHVRQLRQFPPAIASPKNTGIIPTLRKIAISPSSNMRIFRAKDR